VYTTGKTTAAQSGSDLLTSLPLSQNGGSVVLLDSSGNIASAVQYPRYAVPAVLDTSSVTVAMLQVCA